MQKNQQTQNSTFLYLTAKQCLDTRMVPSQDSIDVGCAISVNAVHQKAFEKQIGGGTSTWLLLQSLIASSEFEEVQIPLAGDIIISATGTSTIPNTPIEGHTGIMGNYGIMSNNSLTGLWMEYYTLDTWKERYQVEGGYPTRFFRRL